MDARRLTFIEHLEELRHRLLVCVAAVLVGSVVAYTQAGRILQWLARPVGRLIFVSPFEAFTAYLHIAIVGGVALALPVVLFEVWRYVGPALSPRERRWLLGGFAASIGLFLSGVAVAYVVVIPLGVRFLLSFANETLQPMIAVGQYVGTVGWMLLAFGLVFQLPIVLVLLAAFGLVTAAQLAGLRPYAVVAIFIVAAAVTPGPDVLSQISIAAPMWALFEASIWLIRMVKPHG